MRKSSPLNHPLTLVYFLVILVPLGWGEKIYVLSQASSQGQVKSGLADQPMIPPAPQALPPTDVLLLNEYNPKDKRASSQKIVTSANISENQKILPITHNNVMDYFELQRQLNNIEKPAKTIGFWSTQTLQNIATARLFDRLISSISSGSFSTTTTTTTTTRNGESIITSTTTTKYENINNTNISEVAPPLTPSNFTLSPLPSNNISFELDFKILQESGPVANQIFIFQKSKPLPSVAPIKVTYNDYLVLFKPALFKAPAEVKVFRQSIYKMNLQLINVNNAQVLRQFNMGLNVFTDVQLNQFYKKYNKLLIPENLVKEGLLEQARLKNQNGTIILTTPPRINIDWTCLASEVISQGACGASYIIAPLESIAITMKMYNKTAIFLSIQQVLSCGDGQKGCTSGYFLGTYDYVQKFGVGQSSFYFYDDNAKYNSEVSQCNKAIIGNRLYMKNKVYIEQYKRIRFGDCEQVIKQLRFRALAVAITGNGFQFYSEGTFDAISTNINHGVTLVGYQPDQGFLVKNSWGRTWGLLGYGYVSVSTGVCSFAMYPTIKNEIGTPILCSSQV